MDVVDDQVMREYQVAGMVPSVQVGHPDILDTYSPPLTAGPTKSLATLVLAQSTKPEGWRWQDDAKCLGIDPDLFFPEDGSKLEAKAICGGV